MDALDAIQNAVTAQTVTCDVLRKDGDGYGSSFAEIGQTVDVAFSSPSSSSEVVVEGSGQET